MSNSTLTRTLKFTGFAASLALAVCLSLAPFATRADEKVTFHFAPFSINDAQLFEFVASRLLSTEGAEQLDTLRDELMFTRLGPDSFMVMARGFYLAEPSHGVFKRISPNWNEEAATVPVKLIARSP
ncbi:MAG TPA: hypothetical protein VNZ06_12010 [Steroidobacteraceae bacterium]|jgi:hypothetical protein|nr:hypothetical protein [Steroidobacteraceae bacterium]